MATAHDSAGAPARPDTPTTIPLTTDAEFLQAEADLQRVLADAEATSNIDAPEFETMGDHWRRLHGAILAAEPRTPLQAAVILRAVLCPTNGVTGPNCVEAEHIDAIQRVAGFLADAKASAGGVA